jgi:hypothetical protein
MPSKKSNSASSSDAALFSFHVTRAMPAIYHQIGEVKVVAPNLRTALAQARAGLHSGDLVPEWLAPEDEVDGVELAPGAEPGIAYIDILEPYDVRPVDRA